MSHHRPWPWPRIQAHRGGGALAPENTLAAIRRGCAMGFRAIEIDARLTSDEVPVVIHDRTLERTTDGKGAVAQTTSAAIARLDAGSWFAPEYRGEHVPTLAGTIAFCRSQGIWINLEIKRAAGQIARIGEVVARTAAQGYGDLLRPGGDRAESVVAQAPLLSSFGREALLAARQAAPDLPRGLLVDDVPENFAAELDQLGCVSLHTDHETLTRDKARAVKDAGYWLFCYTVDDPARAREIFAWGVDALCTDRIDLIGAGFA
ncbi:MAG: glycerophosphodiester phosphodiesterase [Burkholderiales bacterium]|jgi:glycerophosphoryl diester phosphodiesterase|nr:glycerophosphodiester phosphodiesterase [Burkholderiales bacterium]